jgi:hypothetical protein
MLVRGRLGGGRAAWTALHNRFRLAAARKSADFPESVHDAGAGHGGRTGSCSLLDGWADAYSVFDLGSAADDRLAHRTAPRETLFRSATQRRQYCEPRPALTAIKASTAITPRAIIICVTPAHPATYMYGTPRMAAVTLKEFSIGLKKGRHAAASLGTSAERHERKRPPEGGLCIRV